MLFDAEGYIPTVRP